VTGTRKVTTMDADALVDSYIADVVKHLPRSQRADVAAELRSLLADELAERGRDNARDLLVGFGRPAEVAARYRPPLTVIDPADSRRFLRLSVIGVAVIWVGGALSADTDTFKIWWEQYAVAALVWPGALVIGFATTAWVRRRWPHRAAWKPPRRAPRDPDHVNRVGWSAALVFFVAGTCTLVFAQPLLDLVTGGGAPGVLTYDETFLRRRAPWLLSLMVLHLLFLGVLIVNGRWTTRLRRIDAVLSLAVCGVITWVLLAGDVYTAAATDEAAKGITALIVLVSVADLAVKLLRRRPVVPGRVA
jgi:hypothetical protein